MTPSPSPAVAPAPDDIPRDAASVVLLREGPLGLEVLMMRRHQNSRDMGGAYVFPGGKLDEADVLAEGDSELARSMQQRLGEPALSAQRALGLFRAAAREAMEECAVHIALEALQPWTRWITPVQSMQMSRRFDTRFFLARMPEGQEARHDNHEATETLWLTPREALRRMAQGDINMGPPQVQSLIHLTLHSRIDSVFDEARRTPPPVIMPHRLQVNGTVTMCYPGDPAHPVATRALPGPTRLDFQDGRFVVPPAWWA